MKKIITSMILAAVILPTIVIAAGGGHEEAAVPYGKIGIQALNLGILLVGIFFFGELSSIISTSSSSSSP